MAGQFDAVVKNLVAKSPAAWLAALGFHHVEQCELVDTDLSTVTASADALFRVTGVPDYLVHLEFQAGHDPVLELRTLRYNVLAVYKFGLIVVSVVLLLKPEADKGIGKMGESTTLDALQAEARTQGIEVGREEGRVAEARRLLLRLGERRFGVASQAVLDVIESIDDLAKLEELADRVLDATSWDEVLG